MRLWLKDSERKPDPAPVVTDDRVALLVGIGAWLVALVVMLLFVQPLLTTGRGWWLWASVAGLAIGLIGLLYTHSRQSRTAQHESHR
jgi:hypothetical protein